MKPSRARYGVIMIAISLAVLSYIQRVAISQAAGPISRDLHLNKAEMGLIFGAFGLSYALFELPMGLLGDKPDRRGLERRLDVGYSLSLWSWRGRVFPESNPYAECLAPEEGEDHGTVFDVGFHPMGRCGNSAAGAGRHRVGWMEMGVRDVRESWCGLVCCLYGVVS